MSRRCRGRVLHNGGLVARSTDPHAPNEPEYRSGPTPLPHLGPRTREEWEVAFQEMYDNDETFREWQSAERRAELAAGR